MRTRLVVGLIAAMLLVSGAAVVAGMTGASVLDPPPDETPHAEYRGVSTDFGLVVNTADATLRSQFEFQTVAHRIDRQDNETPDEVIDEYLAHLEAELDGFAAAEREGLDAFRAGEIDSDDLVRTLVRIDAEARARQATLDGLPQFDGHVPGLGLRAETTNLEQRYDMHTSAVRDLLAAGYADATARPLAFIETTNASLVMAAVDAGEYHREAVRFDRWNRTGADRIVDLSQVETIAAEAYPDAPDAMLIRRAATGLYFVQWSTPTGTITAYVDGAQEAVFLERQQHWFDLLDVTETEAINRSDVTVTIERTFATGPMNVTVTDRETGEPVAATLEVAIDGRWVEVGQTDARGSVWLIEPRSGYELRLTGEFGEVSTAR